MNVEECRSCHAPVVWAVTVRGTAMPVDAHPDPRGNITLEPRGSGAPLAVVNGSGPVADTLTGGVGYLSHFASCPFASSHRRRR